MSDAGILGAPGAGGTDPTPRTVRGVRQRLPRPEEVQP
ncbi:MAG: hypothetical protein QOE93_858 [Actinomycetota bacterium]|nr:hypothetical protein [Actinomycetota bacterium]